MGCPYIGPFVAAKGCGWVDRSRAMGAQRVWEGVCERVWEGECERVWEGVCERVWEGVCEGVWEGVWEGMQAREGGFVSWRAPRLTRLSARCVELRVEG